VVDSVCGREISERESSGTFLGTMPYSIFLESARARAVGVLKFNL